MNTCDAQLSYSQALLCYYLIGLGATVRLNDMPWIPHDEVMDILKITRMHAKFR